MKTEKQKSRKTENRIKYAAIWAVGLVMLALTPAFAIQPDQWVHTAEADFNPGELKNVVVTNLGDVKLAAGVDLIDKMPDPATVIFDMAFAPDGALYLAVGPEGELLKRAGDKTESVLKLEGEQIFALDVYNGELLLAISGETSRLAALRDGKAETLIELPNVRYVWDVIVDGQIIYLATGIEGQLLRIDLSKPAPAPEPEKKDEAKAADDAEKTEDAKEPSDPRVTVLLDAAQPNLLCLGRDAHGRLYAGSDAEGLVYRVRPTPDAAEPAEVFVIYDAPEPEIAALLVMADGTVYAGTAEAEQARPGRLEEARKVESGRPEMEQPAEQPEEPLPPEPELPVPPKPEPTEETDAIESEMDESNQLDVESDGDDDADDSGDSGDEPINVESNIESYRPMAEQPEAAVPEQPTAPQLDALRQIIRDRLEKAREAGEMQMMPSQPRQARRAPIGPATAPRSRTPQQQRKQGNAIYRIGPDFFVTEVFRETVMILRIVEHEGKLLVATGNEGQLFQVDPRAEETTILADMEAQQLPTLIRRNGKVFLGTANPAELHRLEGGFAKDGTYTSIALDAANVSQWGRMQVTATINAASSVRIETRSGNVENPEQGPWSIWSDAVMLENDPTFQALTPREVVVSAPPARFLQYRLTLAGDGATTPVVDEVALNYVMPNLKAGISSIQAQYADDPLAGQPRPAMAPAVGKSAEEPQRDPKLNITWKAEDPNNDQLIYTLEYRQAGTDKWLPLAKDLTATNFTWQTQRVPDGRYHLRVLASDSPDNPPDMALTATRQSDPVIIDNTPPQLVGEPVMVVQNNAATVRFSARDALSLFRSVHWTLDGEDQWHPALPQDLLFDSTSEDFVITIPDLAKGPHVVTIRVIDARGNAVYRAEVVQVK